ncbi:putative polyvalent protein kinase domain-containing protein [Chitinophaga sancti]|uniref:Uncharacterized protein n=1 Tax=Chitinophaga sancti TaxID=1004 RepID=A0A1K1REJ8_9BACT|nr:hypothetical protein [Chitinophaga sancti]WQD65699.1 hypothetical protein U0033_14960 [Chitinophaga sancti]WQG88679.1 hypothetical protein SR876_27510 [Chitinophaga sancti]SFW70437.1 hypothetical protein SAMN05661012_03708 [Chitinophaga sancti]
MFSNDTRTKLEHIVRGAILEGENDHCTAVRNYLCAGFSTSKTVKRDFERNAIIKKEQAEHLNQYAASNNLWVSGLLDKDLYLTRGGEAEVYFGKDSLNVLKVNDAIYYATWLEFFNSVSIHNLLFPNTAYIFLGFTESDGILKAVMQQPFIIADDQVDLNDVKQLLAFNGFENIKRNDYKNSALGILLEDIHDENVISNKGVLFFIDTVFYTISE